MAKNSTMARAFGARIRVTPPDTGLFLLAGMYRPPLQLIAAHGGQIVLIVPGSNRVLALLPGAAYPALLSHRDLRHIGPISIDPERFEHFMEHSGLGRRT